MKDILQYYINISAPNLVNICVDARYNGELSGRLYHCYGKEPVSFANVVELITEMEKLFDTISFPQASTRTRCFLEEPVKQSTKTEKVCSQEEIIKHRGKLGTFVTSVRMRQCSTWQGDVCWIEKEERSGFKNTLDFVKVLDSSVE